MSSDRPPTLRFGIVQDEPLNKPAPTQKKTLPDCPKVLHSKYVIIEPTHHDIVTV